MKTLSLDLDLHQPEMPVLDLSRCHSRPVSHRTAARMVEEFHYAHRVPSIVAAVGMYVDDVLAGVCTYGIPANRMSLWACGQEREEEALELNRLFVHEWAGRNSESWLIGQSFRWLADCWPSYRILVSYADPEHNHRGGIYQATNWLYTGQSGDKRGGWLLNGEKLHRKTFGDRFGNSHSSLTVEKARELFPDIERLTVEPKHRYVHFLGDRRQKRALRAALRWPVLPYPKGEVQS